MLRLLFAFIPLILILLGVESYIYKALLPIFSSSQWAKTVYFLFQFGAYLSVVYAVISGAGAKTEGVKSPVSNIFKGAIIAFALPKIAVSLFLFLEDVSRWLRYAGSAIYGKFNAQEMTVVNFPNRSDLYVALLFLGALLFCVLLLYGTIFGKYNYQVKEVIIASGEVPSAFNGYKIIQISDVHSGTFDSIKKVKKGIDIINAQGADLVLFTGDMVNNMASEIEPFMDIFEGIKSKDGKFSVLGNHDYGDYIKWNSAEDKARNMEQLIVNQAKMGFKMMRNTNEKIEKNGDFINLIGVENWGKPPFPQHGDLEMAAKGIDSGNFNVLMSHDPSHWDNQVKTYHKHINLTLSGHTHGMQLGIDWLGIKWSPVKWRYPKWAGLYSEESRHLYVNRGFGFLGWPGRLGIWPEITLIKLEKI